MIPAIYARVSTKDQDCAMQLTELRAYVTRQGWDGAIEYVEKASGKRGSKRPELERLLQDVRMKRVDVVLVWKLDRFGRSMQDLIALVGTLDSAGVRFIALTQSIDTDKANPASRLLMHILFAVAEFERDLIRERVSAGVMEAKRQGKHCGRPKKVFRRDVARKMREKGQSWRAIARKLNVPQATVRLALKDVKGAA